MSAAGKIRISRGTCRSGIGDQDGEVRLLRHDGSVIVPIPTRPVSRLRRVIDFVPKFDGVKIAIS